MNNLAVRRAVSTALCLATCGGLALAAAPAQAFEFQLGGVSGSLDTTITFGQAWRTESPDLRLIGTANGGTGRSPNIDDGNQNYLAGDTFSQLVKATTELKLEYDRFGGFARYAVLYDRAIEDDRTRRYPIDPFAKNAAGRYGRLLDAFVYGSFQLGESTPLELRVGRQIVSWGESTFIQGGLTAVNPVDVSALRVPGSELKEGFLPQSMVRATIGTSENTSLEGFYLFDWKRTEPEPVGTFFAANDFVGRGGNRVILGFGAFSDLGVDFRPLGGPLISDYQNATRAPNRDAGSSGQFGLAFRWFLPSLGSGTEIGFYAMNYHSRLPLISGRTGTQVGLGNAVGAAVATQVAAQALAAGAPLQSAVATGAAAGRAQAVAAGGDIPLTTLAQYATIGANTQLGRGNVGAQVTGLATHEYGKTARYFIEYPEDLKVFGVSFNTQLGTTGVALQGELTYRADTPLQYDDVELLFATLTPFERTLYPLSAGATTPFPTTCIAGPLPTTLSRCGQLGAFGANQEIAGWGRYDVWQLQATATKAFPPMLGAQQGVLVVEAGVTSIPGLPSKTSGGPNGRGLRFNGPGTSVSGNFELASRHFGEVEPQDRFADDLSWGYRVAGRLDYPGLVGAWNVSPRFSWQHDVRGTTPGPGGNFVEGRYAYTFGVAANLQQRWEVDAAYTVFGGAGRFNDLNDRDFLAASLKFSF